jgi:hypothetical protein
VSRGISAAHLSHPGANGTTIIRCMNHVIHRRFPALLSFAAAVVFAADLDWPDDAVLLLFLGGGCVLVHTHRLGRELASLLTRPAMPASP